MPEPTGAVRSAKRLVIVTGASSGIGCALALVAARNGYDVLLVARRARRLAEVAAEIRAAGGRCETLVADVCAPDVPQRIVDTALRAFGRVDVIVNNAGAGVHSELLAQSDAAIEAQWQLHVAAPLRIARAALPQLESTRGQLVFVGSGVARVPLPEYGAYPLAKAAIRAAAIQLRRELRERGIAVTYVDPGIVATEFHGTMGVHRSRIKPATPQHVAAAILRGIRRRSAVVNAVRWQTAGTVAGEMLATLADPVIDRLRPVRIESNELPAPGAPKSSGDVPSAREQRPASAEAPHAGVLPFDAVLHPVMRRMERVKLSPAFVREALVPGATLELNELAMRWAGMPNKNERAALREVLDVLAAAGYLEPIREETWRVVRGAE